MVHRAKDRSKSMTVCATRLKDIQGSHFLQVLLRPVRYAMLSAPFSRFFQKVDGLMGGSAFGSRIDSKGAGASAGGV